MTTTSTSLLYERQEKEIMFWESKNCSATTSTSIISKTKWNKIKEIKKIKLF